MISIYNKLFSVKILLRNTEAIKQLIIRRPDVASRTRIVAYLEMIKITISTHSFLEVLRK